MVVIVRADDRVKMVRSGLTTSKNTVIQPVSRMSATPVGGKNITLYVIWGQCMGYYYNNLKRDLIRFLAFFLDISH